MRAAAVLLLLLLGLAGCTPSVPNAPPHRIDAGPDGYNALATEAAFRYSIELWHAEARKRFEDPFMVIIHGGEDAGRWGASSKKFSRPSDVRLLAESLHAAMPARDLVFVVCNEPGYSLDVPRCWYVRRKVCYAWPYAAWMFGGPTEEERQAGAGSIWEFVTGAKQ